jgi:hypothetical protein
MTTHARLDPNGTGADLSGLRVALRHGRLDLSWDGHPVLGDLEVAPGGSGRGRTKVELLYEITATGE